MSLPPLPKIPRQFLCTKCGSNTCDGSIDADHPPCSKCGYLGFASDVGHTAEQMQAYGQQCREAALEEAAMAVYEWVQYQYGFAKAEEATAEIRRLK